MPIAVIAFDFDPFVTVADRALRLETLGIAAAILAAILLAALIAGRLGLRRDDLLFILLGVVPGAVLGGRLGHALLHLDYYGVRPEVLLDPSRGALELSLAVVGGALTGACVARLLDATIGRWLHAAALPLLVAIALGKVAMAAGGSGQGAPADVDWATAYLGAGPWGSLAPSIPAHPAQLYEAGVAAVAAVVVIGLSLAGAFRARDGRAFLVAVALWAVGRATVASTWRDDPVVGPLGAGQAIAVAIAVGCILLSVLVRARTRSVERSAGRSARRSVSVDELAWPDPEAPRYL